MPSVHLRKGAPGPQGYAWREGVESETNGQEGPPQTQVSSPLSSFVSGDYRTDKLLYSPWRSEQVATGAVPRPSKDWEDSTGTGVPGAPSGPWQALGPSQQLSGGRRGKFRLTQNTIPGDPSCRQPHLTHMCLHNL